MSYRNPKAQSKYQVIWLREREERYIQDNGPCAICLDADGLKVCHKQTGFVAKCIWSRREEVRQTFLADYYVLCEVCRTKAQAAYRLTKHAIKHGTGTAYKDDGCRCNICKQAHSDRRKLQPSRLGKKRSKQRIGSEGARAASEADCAGTNDSI